jgi:GTPase SAR1 family protein
LVGNKIDLSTQDRIVYQSDAIAFAKKNYLDYYIETSAMTGNNVDKVFYNITKIIYNKIKAKGNGLDGIVCTKHHNPSWYEIKNKNKKCMC